MDLRRRSRDRAGPTGGGVPALAALTARLRALPPALRLGGLAVTVGGAFLVVALSGSVSPDGVRDRIDGLGAAGPLAFVAVSTLLACAFFPGPLLAAAAGLLFGTALGTPVALGSAVLSAVTACLIARGVAGDAVAGIGGRRVQALVALVERRGFVSVLYARVLPGIPFTLFNYAVGLTRIAVVTLAAATALGAAPRTFAYVALGGSFGDLRRPETVIAVAILVAMALGGALTVWLRPSGSETGSSSPDGRSAGLP